MLALYQALKKNQANANDVVWLKNKTLLDKVLKSHEPYVLGDYLHNLFVQWLSDYANAREGIVTQYLAGKIDISAISADFIAFCFERNISLDKEKVLQSFEAHDDISHQAVLAEINKIKPRDSINLLGFGLGTGYYEKIIKQHLLDKGIAKEVRIFGFDPYADVTDKDITFIGQDELDSEKGTKFDIIVSRWVLHHIELKERWKDFIATVNHCEDHEGIVLVVEHGYLAMQFSSEQVRLYKFLIASFDILANIGIRPQNFTNTTPPGLNFYVDYLNYDDFSTIDQGIKKPHENQVYDVGPNFPTQTIWTFKMKKQ